MSLLDFFFFSSPTPFRALLKLIIQKLNLGSYEQRLKIGAVSRPHYAYCVYQAALLAKKLGYQKISVIELGVAGGAGLLVIEDHARKISKLLSMDIEVYGFDSGKGLSEAADYKDLPYVWKKGFYAMDIEKLRPHLKKSKLVIGDIKDTIKDFFQKYQPAPIGAIACDLDFYSSTVNALKIFEGAEKYFSPRVFCYFDDVAGTEVQLYNDYTGERLAINEFNNTHDKIKLGIPYHLLSKKNIETWYYQIWIAHFFAHPDYNKFINKDNLQLPC